MLRIQSKTIYEALGREPVHPFPARMAPGIALRVMTDMQGARVLDPMMGSGTVLAMARARGHHGIGFDTDPLAVLISKVWTTRFDREEVRAQAKNTLERALSEVKHIAVGEAYPEHADEETSRFVRYWFDGHARRQLAALSIAIRKETSERTRNALWCAFSRLIITKQSGASRAMDLSHSRPHRVFKTAPEKPFKGFLSAVERVIANGIDVAARECGPEPTITLGDARDLPLPDRSVDLVLTSPPYLNAIDYIRSSKFSLVWMGYGIAELRQIRTDSVGTEAGQGGLAEDRASRLVLETLNLRPKLATRHEQILCRYIHDMRRAIDEVGRVLASTGKAVYVVGENTLRGTYIRTSVIVTALAALAGFSVKERRIRNLPANRRYMPPPACAIGTMNARMRKEVILTFAR